jgi:SAM-dependent methyltransferase
MEILEMAQVNVRLYAQLYDELVHDWPGEIDFYRQLIAERKIKSLLEVACGTGRVLLKLVRDDIQVTGIDRNSTMLEIARNKAKGHPNVTLLEGDMRSFDLGKNFQLAIIPAHSFQFMLTPEDQVNCLGCVDILTYRKGQNR